MTNPTPLSPAAQAVLDAFYTGDGGLDYLDRFARYDERIAAALRAAADQLMPEENVDEADYDCLQAKWADQGKQEARAQILAIAAELEGTND